MEFDLLGRRSIDRRFLLWNALLPVPFLCLLIPASRAGWWAAGALVVGYAGAMAVGLYVVTRWLRRLADQLRANDGQFCLKCGYNLADSLDWGNCPECGVPYDIEAVREKWRAVVRYDHKQAGRRVELDE